MSCAVHREKEIVTGTIFLKRTKIGIEMGGNLIPSPEMVYLLRKMEIVVIDNRFHLIIFIFTSQWWHIQCYFFDTQIHNLQQTIGQNCLHSSFPNHNSFPDLFQSFLSLETRSEETFSTAQLGNLTSSLLSLTGTGNTCLLHSN